MCVCVHSGDGFQCACGSASGEYIECAIILRVKTGDKSNSPDLNIIEASLQGCIGVPGDGVCVCVCVCVCEMG